MCCTVHMAGTHNVLHSAYGRHPQYAAQCTWQAPTMCCTVHMAGTHNVLHSAHGRHPRYSFLLNSTICCTVHMAGTHNVLHSAHGRHPRYSFLFINHPSPPTNIVSPQQLSLCFNMVAYNLDAVSSSVIHLFWTIPMHVDYNYNSCLSIFRRLVLGLHVTY
jgi:hypothetical protein